LVQRNLTLRPGYHVYHIETKSFHRDVMALSTSVLASATIGCRLYRSSGLHFALQNRISVTFV